METDKLTITMDSTATGTVLKILHPEGDTVPITQPIAIVGEPGEDISGLLGDAPAATPRAAEKPRASAAEAAPAAAPVPAVEHAPGERVFSSPRARLRAEENGVDIAAVPGSGRTAWWWSGTCRTTRKPAHRDAAGRQPGPHPGH